MSPYIRGSTVGVFDAGVAGGEAKTIAGGNVREGDDLKIHTASIDASKLLRFEVVEKKDLLHDELVIVMKRV